jgi:hypothetical protein
MAINHIPQKYDSPTRFLLPSSKKGEVHLVDLTAYNYNGECSCEDFTCKRVVKIREKGTDGNNTRCKHIIYVRDCLVDVFISALEATREISQPNK